MRPIALKGRAASAKIEDRLAWLEKALNEITKESRLTPNSAALSVFGQARNKTGPGNDIVAGADGHVLQRSGDTLAFAALGTAAFENTGT
ncbi:MAG: hypothetical protein H0V46_02225, partial [Sphingomonas sp.]|nr:hypothetical protein [Sphingomonas sp.]